MSDSTTDSAKTAFIATAESLQSTFHEQVVEHLFIAELLQEAWLRYNKVVEVMHSEVDAYGYDLILECDGIVRHVQLKASRHDATTSFQKVGLALGSKPSGCVVWIKRKMLKKKKRFKLSYLFFGDLPKRPLPDLLAKNPDGKDKFPSATHTKPSTGGGYKSRPAIREVKRAYFTPYGSVANKKAAMTMAELFIQLFGLQSMSFEEIKALIKQQALLHQAANESFEYEQAELHTFRQILRFAIAEGFIADASIVDKTLNGVNLNDEEEDDEYTTWHYMHQILEQIDEDQNLPPQAAELYLFWKTAFWGTDKPEESA